MVVLQGNSVPPFLTSVPVSAAKAPSHRTNTRGLPHHRQSAVVQCLLPSRGAASLDYRASHVSAYLLRGFRSLMPLVQLVNSVPTPSLIVVSFIYASLTL
jgi:hypothetical protein